MAQIRWYMYVWSPFVETYLQMGWTFTPDPLIYEDRGGHSSWLMEWQCQCRIPYLKERAQLLGERERVQ